MRLLLVADTYPPARISGALQMHDLATALARFGHRPAVLVPARLESGGFQQSLESGVDVLRVQAPRTKDVPYLQRTLAEWRLPAALLRGLRASPLQRERWDGIVWYSPTIFLGPLVRALRREQNCPSYLIVRDLFPDWAADAGVLRRGGLPFRLFKQVERYQYRHAGVIGVQTPSNVALACREAPPCARIEVLHNWLSPPREARGVVVPSEKLAGRTILVYAGNMGVAQELDAFVELAKRLVFRVDVGLLFIGRGSEAARLKQIAQRLGNLDVRDEVAPDDLSDVLKRNLANAMQRGEADGFTMQRRLWFMGRPLPVRQDILRAWKTGRCRFSDVLVNEHPLVEGSIAHVTGDMEHHDSPDLHHWLEKQNAYTTSEAIAGDQGRALSAQPQLFGNRLERRMWIKKNYRRFPGRYLILFLYHYLIQGAWRAGWVGYAWSRLRSDVYRLWDYKLREIRITGRLPLKRPCGPGQPDARVAQFE